METLTYYIDMDGVIANFSGQKDALERFKVEQGFFAHLEPIRQNLNAVKMLIRKGKKVKVITKSPNEQADKDKMLWLQEFLPELEQHNIIIVRLNDMKSRYVENIKQAILFDDYGKNCEEWRRAGGKAVKVKTKSQLLEMVVG